MKSRIDRFVLAGFFNIPAFLSLTPSNMRIHLRIAWLLVMAACAFASLPAYGQSSPHVFRGATIYPVSAAPITNGVLVVHEGRVVAVGPSSTRSPRGAVEIDVTGKVIIPGLVDTHSHVGRVEGGDDSAPLHPGVRSLDAIDVLHSSIDRARAGGITTVNVMPGSGLAMSGQTTYLKLRDGTTVEDLLFCSDPINDVCGGMKMANGTNPLRSTPGTQPQTRARTAAVARQRFVEALAYRKQLEDAGDAEDERPARDLEKEALLEVLDGRRVVHFHTHRHDDIITALRLQKEFGFRIVLQHVSEGWRVADEIAAAGAPASIILIDSPGGKLEAIGLRLDTGARLAEAGVDVAYHTDDYITDSRLFLRSAAIGARAGLSPERALEALTLAGARMMDLERRVGSLEPDKDADFVVLSGDPLSVYTRVEETWVEGVRVFDLDDPEDHAVAVGGFEALDPDFLHHHD